MIPDRQLAVTKTVSVYVDVLACFGFAYDMTVLRIGPVASTKVVYDRSPDCRARRVVAD